MDVQMMCRLFGIARSSYYAWLCNPAGSRGGEDVAMMPRVKEAFETGRRTYGTRRIRAVLTHMDIHVGRRRIRRLMDCQGLHPQTAKAFRHTTTRSQNPGPKVPDLLNRRYHADAPNRIWTGDITIVFTLEGVLYLAIIEDVFSRFVVGWSMMERQTVVLVLGALNNACARRNPPPGCIFHSDHGTQYDCGDFRHGLDERHFIQSMGSIGDCYDNAITESAFSTIKSELLLNLRKVFKTRNEARCCIFDYIESFYNRTRIHSSLGYLSPEKFEKRVVGG
jgi:putative transposase